MSYSDSTQKDDYQAECNRLRSELIAVMKSHPDVMPSQAVGILEILKFDLIEKLERGDP